MLADTPWPRGFGAALASVDTFFQGLQNSSLPPRSALQATCDGTHGLIEFLLSRQSFSAALQVALRVADDPPKIRSQRWKADHSIRRHSTRRTPAATTLVSPQPREGQPFQRVNGGPTFTIPYS